MYSPEIPDTKASDPCSVEWRNGDGQEVDFEPRRVVATGGPVVEQEGAGGSDYAACWDL